MLGILAFLDDDNIAIEHEHIAAFTSFFREFSAEMSAAGLELSLPKCVYLDGRGGNIPELDVLGLRREERSIRVLGAFVGDKADIKRRISEKVADHEEFFALLKTPELHAGVAFDVLRFCGVPRVCHLARTHPPDCTLAALQRFDDMVDSTAAALIQLTPEALRSPLTTAQLSLPMALGGFGLSRYAELAEIAYAASVEQFGTVPAANPPDQAARTALFVKKKRDDLIAQLGEAGTARLLSCEGKGCWLNYSSHMPSTAAWRIAAQIRLQAEITGVPSIRCQPCQKTITPIAFADHVMVCRHLGHYTAVHRHDLVTNVIVEVLRDFGCVVAAAHTGMHEDSASRADIIVTAPHMGGQICVDVSVTHPCAESHARAAAAKAGSAAANREAAKEAKHGEAARTMYGNFSPWVFETFGRWGAAFRRDVKALEANVGPRRALSLRQSLRRHIALAIQVGNADMVANALRTATRAQQTISRPSCFLLPAARALLEPPAPAVIRQAFLNTGVLLEPLVR